MRHQNRIELKRLGFFAFHGVTGEEARLGQRFYVDVVLELDNRLRFDADDLGQTVNYAEIYAGVEAAFTGRRFQLIEAAAEAIAAAVLEGFPLVSGLSVRVEKPSVPVDCLCDHFAVEVTRCR